MPNNRVLITGGAGFIGSYLTDALLHRGHEVRIFDNLDDQVHQGQRPSYLNPHAEFVLGDVRDANAIAQALDDVELVVHCAAAVGVAQSQYEIKRYTDTNVGGTANLLDCIVNGRRNLQKLLVLTSMTSYGEGAYECPEHGRVRPGLRHDLQLQRKQWEPMCPHCQITVTAVPTVEKDDRQSSTIYALTKNMQEDMVLNIGNTYQIPSVALRLFNVFGPRQSLSNPYTGVTAIFASRIKNLRAPVVFEDGGQSRDFISVHDVVKAILLALSSPQANGEVFNVGSGRPIGIADIARKVAAELKSDLAPEITGNARKNDVRHCFASTRKIESQLGWQAAVSFEEGLRELIAWSHTQESRDDFESANAILKAKNLYS